jgi:hypothetical protein
MFDNVKQCNRERFKISMTDEFVPRIIAELRRSRAPAMRVHVVGDYYSPAYTRKWIEIVQAFPDIHFFGSTRSWRVPKITKTIERLRDEPNVYLRASMDYTDTLTPKPEWSVWSVDGRGESCPHDRGRVISCYVCGRCWTDRDISTRFELRWGDHKEYRSTGELFG